VRKTHPSKKIVDSLLHYEQNLCSYLYLAVVKISLKMHSDRDQN